MTPSAAPRVSVVLATWNRASLLPRALRSLEAQTYAGWEAWVVDDGSTDDSAAAVSPWLADPRYNYLPRPHAGLSAARNAGISESRGSWITFLDSDDEYAPEHLASRLRTLAAHRDADLLHGGYLVIGPPEAHFVPDAEDPTRLIPLADCVVGGTFFVRAAFLRRLGGFPDVPYGMDFALMRKAVAAGGRILTSPDPTYLYHREPGVGMCEERRR